MISHATVQEGGQFVLSAFSSVTIFCKKKMAGGNRLGAVTNVGH
jgi:hypothetical protein